MDYTDKTLQGTSIKKVHYTELQTAIGEVASSKKVTVAVDLSFEKLNALNVQNVQNAIHKLESSFSQNCCQANCCQTCQGCQSSSCQSECSLRPQCDCTC